MADLGHIYTDKEIAILEAKLKKEYAQALREMQEESKKVLSRFAETDRKMIAKLDANEITQDEYVDWRRRGVLRTEQVSGLIKDLSARLVNADKVAADMINNASPKVYAENANFATYQIEKMTKLNTSFTLLNQGTVKHLLSENNQLLPKAKVDIPKDKKWNEQHIRSAMTQGVLKGEGIPKIAKRLQKVTDMDRTAATRNARTIMTGAQNVGRMDSFYRARDMGIGIKKVWMSTLDNITRDSHVALDGEVQELDKPFSNGLDYPGASGPPEEVYNCRCRVVPEYDKYKTDWSNLKNRNTDKLGDMSYQEWKDAHKKQGKLTLGETGLGYSDAQQKEMLALLAGANPVTRGVFQKFANQLSPIHPVEEGDKEDAAYFSSADGFVHFDISKNLEDSVHEKYQTHFHEYGHNIDFLAGNDFKSWASRDYRDSKGRTFGEIINSEWEKLFKSRSSEIEMDNFRENLDISKGGMGGRSFVDFRLREWRDAMGLSRRDPIFQALKEEFDKAQTDAELEAFYKKHLDKWAQIGSDLMSTDRRKIFTGLKQDLIRKYPLRARADLSDMLEPYVCKNIGNDCQFPLGCGHGWEYTHVVGSLEKEAFTEMFSCEIANKEGLEVIKTYLPESYKAYREILEGILNG